MHALVLGLEAGVLHETGALDSGAAGNLDVFA
jgi:hypothetical protein